MANFVSGGIAMACLVIALIFLRFHRRLQDRFFILFSVAFGILALERLLLAATDVPQETQSYYYLIRLLAFVTILYAIFDKNRRNHSS